MSAFIGHGDSDKSASNNPFSRAYDELWVAGEAGADRYRRSGPRASTRTSTASSDVRRCTRSRASRAWATRTIPTVLYAPTWEGVNLDQEYSSVSAVGVKSSRRCSPPSRRSGSCSRRTRSRDSGMRSTATSWPASPGCRRRGRPHGRSTTGSSRAARSTSGSTGPRHWSPTSPASSATSWPARSPMRCSTTRPRRRGVPRRVPVDRRRAPRSAATGGASRSSSTS